MKQYPKPGTRVRSTETGAIGTYLGNGITCWDECTINGVHWAAREGHWSRSKMELANDGDGDEQEEVA